LTNTQWKVVAISSAVVLLGLGIAIATGELNLSGSQKGNLVSPFQFPPN
jgi:hypothetical protein